MKLKIKILFLLIILFLPNFVFGGILDFFTPFGGKITSYNPVAPGCAAITTAVSVATLGSVNLTVEEIKVGNPKSATLGILRINGISVMPPPTNIKMYYSYMVPGTYVLGNSINICSVCSKLDQISDKIGLKFLKDFCSNTEGIDIILEKACGVVGEACPINNLIYQIGTSMPFSVSGGITGALGGLGDFSFVKSGVCGYVNNLNLPKNLLTNLCGSE